MTFLLLLVFSLGLLPASEINLPGLNDTAGSADDCAPESPINCVDQGNTLVRLPDLPSVFDSSSTEVASAGNSSVMTGRIASILLPVIESMNSSEMAMESDTRMEAMEFSMAQDVTWILVGNWNLTLDDPVSFNATFSKVTVDGQMRHTHIINNFTLDENYTPVQQDEIVIPGHADVYFNDQLAWKQAMMNVTLFNDNALRIDIEPADIDNHFHGEPIYGIADQALQ